MLLCIGFFFFLFFAFLAFFLGGNWGGGFLRSGALVFFFLLFFFSLYLFFFLPWYFLPFCFSSILYLVFFFFIFPSFLTIPITVPSFFNTAFPFWIILSFSWVVEEPDCGFVLSSLFVWTFVIRAFSLYPLSLFFLLDTKILSLTFSLFFSPSLLRSIFFHYFGVSGSGLRLGGGWAYTVYAHAQAGSGRFKGI